MDKEKQHTRGYQRSKDVTQTQQQRPESPTVTLCWHARKYKVQQSTNVLFCVCSHLGDIRQNKVHKLHQRYIPKWMYKCNGQVQQSVNQCFLSNGDIRQNKVYKLHQRNILK